METNVQQQTTWSGHRYLLSHSGWRRPGILSTLPSLPNRSRNALSDLDGTEDDVLWAEQHDKSNTDSDKEGNDIYDDMMTHEQIFSEESDNDQFWGFD